MRKRSRIIVEARGRFQLEHPGVLCGAQRNDQPQQRARHYDRGEHAHDDAEAERQREALDDADAEAVAEHEQDRASNQRRGVRVADGRPSLGEARLDGGAQRLAAAQLFFQAREDQHVRVDRQADRENEAGDACQCQRDRDEPVEREADRRVDQQRNCGQHAW